jgi:rhodanese-related sulfurtransferase
VDLGLPPTSLLFPAPYRGPTPSSHTKAEVVTTEGLAQLLNQGGRVLLIDTSGASNTLPQALAVPDAGRDGSVTDSFQQALSSWLQEQTGGNGQVPIVFFGASMQDRSSYNGALRAGQLGWHVYWYRGGIEAWVANGLPLAPAQ